MVKFTLFSSISLPSTYCSKYLGFVCSRLGYLFTCGYSVDVFSSFSFTSTGGFSIINYIVFSGACGHTYKYWFINHYFSLWYITFNIKFVGKSYISATLNSLSAWKINEIGWTSLIIAYKYTLFRFCI